MCSAETEHSNDSSKNKTHFYIIQPLSYIKIKPLKTTDRWEFNKNSTVVKQQH